MNKFPMASKLEDLIVFDNRIRNTWTYKPKLDPEHKRSPLTYSKYIEYYTNEVLAHRKVEHIEAVKDISSALHFEQKTTLICCIPCHASEDVDQFNIKNIVDSVTKVSGHVVILVNGARGTCTPEQLEQMVHKLQRSVGASVGSLTAVSIVPHLFDRKYPIGAIRGTLIDSVAIAAGRSGIVDPIVVSMDIDIMSVPENYASIILDEFQSPALDILSGPVFYGYSHIGENYTGQTTSVPELFLGNRAMYFRKLAVANGLKYGRPFYPTDGPNTAYRLAAYCAAGGHNYSLESGEDSYIGAAIFGIRSLDSTLYPVEGHAVYRPGLWVATDPRRQLRTICSGHPIDATWREVPFDLKLGSSMSTRELARIYAENSNFLQSDDILKDSDKGLHIGKAYDSIIKIYEWACANKGLPDEAISFVRNRYGLELGGAELPGEEGPLTVSNDLTEALIRSCGQAL